MLGRLGDAFQRRLMKQDERTPEEKKRDELRAERKVKKENKLIDIECYFTEIEKIKVTRQQLIKKGKGSGHEVKQLTDHISEGIKDLEAEIEALKDILKSAEESTYQAEELGSRCAQLKLKEGTDGFEGSGNISINVSHDQSSEMQDLNTV